MNIRRFAPADADAVVRVSELATRITSGKVYDQTFVEEMVENQTRAYFLRRGEQMHFYVACEDDGTVIGCAAIGRPYRDDPAESCLYSVFVLPEKQNRGVGRALIGAIERDPWFLTARRVIIPASINALHFYQGLLLCAPVYRRTNFFLIVPLIPWHATAALKFAQPVLHPAARKSLKSLPHPQCQYLAAASYYPL